MPKRQPTRRFETRKAAIVASAVGVLNRKGVRGMTLADVAASLDLVPTAVIYYFKNKEELAQACFLKAIDRFDQLLDAGAAGQSAEQRVGLFLKAYFDFKCQVVTGAAEPVAVFNDVRALNQPAVNDAYIAMFRKTRALLVGPETSRWTRTELNARAHLLISEVFWTVAWIYRHDAEDFGRIAGRVIAMTVDGLAAPHAAWSPIPLPASVVEGPDAANELFLRAATELINEEGYVGASVEKISARLNVTKGAFYHHHETKDELVIACFERTFQVMRAAIREAERVGRSGYQVLTTAASALVEYQMSGNARLLRTSALTSAPEAIQPRLLGEFDRISLRFASLIGDGIADGSIRPVDANLAAQMMTGMINASAELHFWTKGVTADVAVQTYVRPFFEGLFRA